MVDAGVEEHVFQQVFAQQRLLQLLRKSPVATPMIRRRAAAMRNDEAHAGKVLEQIALNELHHRGRVGVDVVGAGCMEAGIAARRDVHHRRDVVLDHLFVDRIPVSVGQWRDSSTIRQKGQD